MELSEAKETLKNIKRCCFEDEQYQKYGFMELYTDISDIEAINTVLKALDNSIDKKQHDMIIKSMNSIIDSLQEKLDNSINKDEVKEKIQDLKDEFDSNNSKGLYGNDYYIVSEQYEFAEEKLQELLGE